MQIPTEVIGQIDWRGYSLVHSEGAPADTLKVLLSDKSAKGRYRVLFFHRSSQWETETQTNGEDFHFAQPMPEGVLVAAARQDGPTANAKIYSWHGDLIRDFDLGDGIQNLQCTSTGDIWVSYFDEGVFGHTIASAGLVRFDPSGGPVYKFQPRSGTEFITDCYALNVESDQIAWCYYYTEFPLVQLRGDAIEGLWHPGISGSTGFAVWSHSVIMQSGYDREDWSLLQLGKDGDTANRGRVEFVDEAGDPLPARCATARGRMIWFLQNSKVYRADISQMPEIEPRG